MIRRHFLRFVFLLALPVLGLLSPGRAFADVLQIITSFTGTTTCSPTNVSVNTGNQAQSCNGLLNDGAGGGTVSVTAHGDLAMGDVGAAASVSNSIDGTFPQTNDSASAVINLGYNFHITGTPGATALLIFGNADGTSLITYHCPAAVPCTSPTSSAGATVGISAPPEQFVGLGSGGGAIGLPSGALTPFEIDVPITNGVAVFSLSFSVFSRCLLGFNSYADSCTAEADYSHTLNITGASALDSNGAVLNGVSVVSDSGFNPNAGAGVPEPSSVSELLTAGALALLLVRSRLEIPRC